ncbi:unnamed protein product [[Candida] boidinii]|uniref:Unnamed protein product n=1 Tax=Candida boidinii TaxID=5477 RepID=A0A9W6WKJ5_CANBO|nr:unnamed protein product [[Candida] boidinii]GMG35613.1 unnamed protein product [[Candida] boidinii]
MIKHEVDLPFLSFTFEPGPEPDADSGEDISSGVSDFISVFEINDKDDDDEDDEAFFDFDDFVLCEFDSVLSVSVEEGDLLTSEEVFDIGDSGFVCIFVDSSVDSNFTDVVESTSDDIMK